MKIKNCSLLLGFTMMPFLVTANDAVTLYGRAHLGLQNTDKSGQRETEVESYNSRLGVKGDASLDSGVEVFYRFEFNVEVSDDNASDNISARSQYVGLRGNYGEVLVGRNDTPLKKSQGKTDLMNEFSGDINTFFVGDNRLGDTIQYTTPALNHLKFTVSYIAEENSKQQGESGLSMAASYGDSKLKQTNVYIALAHDSEVAGQDINRVTVQGKLDDLKLGAMYQQSEALANNEDVDSYMVSASYQISSYTLLAQYQGADGATGKLKDSGSAASLGVEKSFTKQARMYLWYSKFSLDNKPDFDAMAVTLRYDF